MESQRIRGNLRKRSAQPHLKIYSLMPWNYPFHWSVSMERAQNSGITVLHPRERSADRSVDENDIVFEYVVTQINPGVKD